MGGWGWRCPVNRLFDTQKIGAMRGCATMRRFVHVCVCVLFFDISIEIIMVG